jgi:hypothetical protein
MGLVVSRHEKARIKLPTEGPPKISKPEIYESQDRSGSSRSCSVVGVGSELVGCKLIREDPGCADCILNQAEFEAQRHFPSSHQSR